MNYYKKKKDWYFADQLSSQLQYYFTAFTNNITYTAIKGIIVSPLESVSNNVTLIRAENCKGREIGRTDMNKGRVRVRLAL